MWATGIRRPAWGSGYGGRVFYEYPLPQAECAILKSSEANMLGLPSPHTGNRPRSLYKTSDRTRHKTDFNPSSVTSQLSGLKQITTPPPPRTTFSSSAKWGPEFWLQEGGS